jgi:CheY-like chemotaxis protein
MLAHELRNPLAPVVTGLHILGLSEADRRTVEQARGMMERQLRHLTRLVDDLMDVSRITLGRVQVRRERLDLARVVREAAEDRRPLVEQAGMQLTVEVPAAPVWVAGDATRLAQVLNNLLDNAVKFRNGGSSVSVRLGAEPGGAWAVLDVRDHGIGIEPDLFPRLFDVFAQADVSLERTRGGLGVGLSIVRGLVHLHGGEVEATSGGPGQGAAFTVRLPLKEEQPALTEVPAAPAGRLAPPLRVLIVEDNRDAADSLRVLLELSGHEVAVAYDGQAGVKAAREWRPDVVLCDIGLPGLDGYGVAGELRRDPATAQVPLIAITGYGGEQDRKRSREAGFDHHLTKPVDPDDLQPLLVRPA